MVIHQQQLQARDWSGLWRFEPIKNSLQISIEGRAQGDSISRSWQGKLQQVRMQRQASQAKVPQLAVECRIAIF
ncbi:MAG TPA: hypothetical protein VET88_14175, partial [Gammaproteobacteria bacterium]|nr:hypothetical protein [Gammaproteobacteria bacterium]